MTTIHNLLKRDSDCGCSFIATPLIDNISEPWNEFSYSPLYLFKSFLLLIEIPVADFESHRFLPHLSEMTRWVALIDDPRQSSRSLVRACSSSLCRTCSSSLSPQLIMIFMTYPSHICKVNGDVHEVSVA